MLTDGQGSISLVIPAYNAEAFLGRAIRSALNQTRPPDEIIVVDDGSTDDTARVAAEFGNRVRYVRQDNAGASAARNRGIREAHGEFVAFLDADDEWLPGHMERAVNVLARNRDLEWFVAGLEERGPRGHRHLWRAPADLVDPSGRLRDYLEAEAAGTFTHLDTMVVRRQALFQVGLLDETLRVGEDRDLWFRLGLRFPEAGYDGRPGAVFWRNEGSLTHRQPGSTRDLILRVRRHWSQARELGPQAVRRSTPLLRFWVHQGLGNAFRQGDGKTMRELCHEFGELVSAGWKVKARLCTLIPKWLWSLLNKMNRMVRPCPTET